MNKRHHAFNRETEDYAGLPGPKLVINSCPAVEADLDLAAHILVEEVRTAEKRAGVKI